MLEFLFAGFGALYALGALAVVLLGLGALIYYIATAKKEQDSETFEKRNW